MKEYKFYRFVYDIEFDIIKIDVAFRDVKIKNKWNIKTYPFKPTGNTMDLDYYMGKVKEIIKNE
jgi:hypothetical protein